VHWVVIDSDDPIGLKEVALIWQGHIEPLLVPAFVHAENNSSDQAYEQTLKLIFPGGTNTVIPELVGVECDDKNVHITQGDVNPSAQKASHLGAVRKIIGERDVKVKIDPPSQGSVVSRVAKIHVRTGEAMNTISLPMRVSFRSNHLVPEVANIAFSSGNRRGLVGQMRAVEIQTTNANSKVIVIDAPKWLRVTIEKERDATTVCRVGLLELLEAQTASSVLVLATSDEPQKTVSIPVTYYSSN
jgi:hypothetical protein